MNRYRLVDLGVPFQGESQAVGVNDAGWVIGNCALPSRAETDPWGWIWRSEDWSAIPLPPGCTCGGVTAINNGGQVVGSGVGPGAPPREAPLPRSFLWEGGRTRELWDAEASIRASDINEHGQVTGWSAIPSKRRRAAHLWDTQRLLDLGTLPGARTAYAAALNNNGWVVGNSDDHPFLWRNGAMEPLPALPGFLNGFPGAVNDDGVIVGHCSREVPGPAGETPPMPQLETRLCLWDRDTVVELGSLGGELGHLDAVNEAGQAVGYAQNSTAEDRAVLWEDGALHDLNHRVEAPGWTLTHARDINNHGWIVGVGRVADAERLALFGGEPSHFWTVERAFLLIPEST